MNPRSTKLSADVICKTVAGLSADIPSEFKIFSMGVNDSSQGSFLFDEVSAKKVLAAQVDRGNKYSLDYEHQAMAMPPVEAPAAGWYDLEIRTDGLYAVNLKWTERAAAALGAKEYRFFSPAFAVEETGDGMVRVTDLINVALTNLPAMKNLVPLVAARVGVVAIEDAAATELRAGDEECDCEPDDDNCDCEDEYMNEEMKTAIMTLGLKEGFKEPEAAKEISALGAFRQAVVTLAGAESADQALGLVTAWKRSHGEIAMLSERIAVMEKEKEAGERTALIDRCVREGKLAPKDDAMKAWLCSLPLASVRGFADAAPAAQKQVELKQDASVATVTALGDQERKLLRQFGVTEEKYSARMAGK